MVKRQRELIASGNYVAEGRDIGTVVSPDVAAQGLPDGERAGASAPPRGRDR